MRAAESINLVYFVFVTVLALVWPLPRNQRILAAVTGMCGLAVVFAAQMAPSWVRDWLPAPLMVMAYRQAGFFFQKPMMSLQAALQNFDAMVLKAARRLRPGLWARSALAAYFEAVYFLCYPLVPGGLLVLYFHGFRGSADTFWKTVLPAAYLCYVVVPFLPTLPPRLVEQGTTLPNRGVLRDGNLAILTYVSIGANTFPSGHAAASVAVALVLLQFAPVSGAVFMFLAISINIASVAQRYHYTLDCLLGALVALLVFAVTGS